MLQITEIKDGETRKIESVKTPVVTIFNESNFTCIPEVPLKNNCDQKQVKTGEIARTNEFSSASHNA